MFVGILGGVLSEAQSANRDVPRFVGLPLLNQPSVQQYGWLRAIPEDAMS